MKIALHLGAHKTGSTFIQDALDSARPMLAKHGVAYVPRAEFRTEVTRKIGLLLRRTPEDRAIKHAQGAGALAAMIEAASGADRLILSDENLIGNPSELVRTQKLYPTSEQRLAVLAPLLSGQDVEIFLAIRHHGQFARSLYGEALNVRLPRFIAPDEFRDGWEKSAPSWVPLVKAILTTFPSARLTVWNFLDFKKDPGRFLNLLAGLEPPIAFDTSEANRRPSLSHNAIEALLEIGARDGVAAMLAERKGIARKFPRAEGNWTYRMWSDEQEKAFQQALRKDLKAMSDMGERVCLVQ